MALALEIRADYLYYTLWVDSSGTTEGAGTPPTVTGESKLLVCPVSPADER